MAKAHSPEGLMNATQARRSTMPAAPKLRDSCHACSASKVKCDKAKPTCARCAKRNVACEYCITKRAGRKREKRLDDSSMLTTALPWSSSSSSPETAFQTSSPNLFQPQPIPWQPTSSYPDLSPTYLPPSDPASSSALTNLSTDFNDLFASPMSFPYTESSDMQMLTQPPIDTTGMNSSSMEFNGGETFHMPANTFSHIDSTVSNLPALSRPCPPLKSRSSTTSTGDSQGSRHSNSKSPCSCLARALGRLEQLFPNASTACTRSTGQDYENATGQLPTIQSVIAENEETIEAIDSLLQCTCSQDSYLLAILSLIVFKLLSWYEAAARERPMTENSQSPTKTQYNHRRESLHHSEQVIQFSPVDGSDSHHGKDQDRVAAQLVLSELHRVQRLVNILSQRLKLHGTRNGGVGNT